jgi:hypothetical protein
LSAALAGCLSDRRQAAKVEHELVDQLKQRVVSIAVGCPDGNDAAKLREDPMLKMACDRDPLRGQALASQPTLSRFENSVNTRQLLQMGYTLAETVIAEQARRRRGRKLRRILIDIDPTCDPTYGAQQLTLFNGYYDTYCHLPLVVTVSFGWERRKYPVAAVLRCGTAGPMVGTIGEDARDNDRYLIHNLDYRYGPQGAFDFYYGHGDMENNIKELKNDLAMDRTSCSRSTANQFRLLLTLAAYVLLQSVAERTSDLDLLKAQRVIAQQHAAPKRCANPQQNGAFPPPVLPSSPGPPSNLACPCRRSHHHTRIALVATRS